MTIAIDLPRALPEREPKEMLTVVQVTPAHRQIRINYSSYDLIATCKRKAHFALNRSLVASNESEATIFGSAVHAAMETWYCAPRDSRRRSSAQCDDSQALMSAGQAPLAHASGHCVRCAAVFSFIKRAEALAHLDPANKRSLANGITILNAYFDEYATDPFIVLSDDIGPIVERRAEFDIDVRSDVSIRFFGTIDSVFRNEATNHVLVCDHKTTSALGNDFLQRIHPNWQYVGYVTAFRSLWGPVTRTMMSNGIQVAKTKQSFARQFHEVSDEEIAEWHEAMIDVAYDWLRRKDAQGPFPGSAPNACTMWGGCQYRLICESSPKVRESVIQAQYEQRGESHG